MNGTCCGWIDTCPTHACPHHDVSCPNYISRAEYGWPNSKAEGEAAVEKHTKLKENAR